MWVNCSHWDYSCSDYLPYFILFACKRKVVTEGLHFNLSWNCCCCCCCLILICLLSQCRSCKFTDPYLTAVTISVFPLQLNNDDKKLVMETPEKNVLNLTTRFDALIMWFSDALHCILDSKQMWF